MGVTAKSLGIDNLEIDERIELIGDLWDGLIDTIEGAPLNDEIKEELDRRLATSKSDPDNSVAWDDVKKEALGRLKS